MPSRRKITALEQISRPGPLHKAPFGSSHGQSPKRAYLRSRGLAPPEPRSRHGSRIKDWFAPQGNPNISVYVQTSTPMAAEGQQAQGRLHEVAHALSCVQQTLGQIAMVSNTSQCKSSTAQPAMIAETGGLKKSAQPNTAMPIFAEDADVAPSDGRTLTNEHSNQEIVPKPTSSAFTPIKPIKKTTNPDNRPSPRAPVHCLADAVALGLRSDTLPHARHRTSTDRPWGRIDGQSQRRHIASVAERSLDRRMMIALIVSVTVLGLVTTLLSVGV